MATKQKIRELFSIDAMVQRFKDEGLEPIRGDYGIRTRRYAPNKFETISNGVACLIGSFEHMAARMENRALADNRQLAVDVLPEDGILGVTPRQLRLLESGWEGCSYGADDTPRNEDEVELIELGIALGNVLLGRGSYAGPHWANAVEKRLKAAGVEAA